MKLLSWNVQAGKSSDGNCDFIRTLEYIRSLGDFDVICLQELARYMKEYCRPDQLDQLKISEQFFSRYAAVWGSGFSWQSNSGRKNERQEFGNLTLVKSDPLDFKVHQLPLPATPGKKQMQRVAVETLVESKLGPLSIINTHLAFHDGNETQLQLEQLCKLEQERSAQHGSSKQLDTGVYQKGILASARVLCGDFNLTPDSSHYQYQIDNNWIDGWQLCHPGEAQLPTCGIFDSEQWSEGPHCRDYFWMSHELKSCQLQVSVDTGTDLSDHQPIMLELSI
jgi:endonuclease/exonuclease/phosphatase family metal-dependent hydrolase